MDLKYLRVKLIKTSSPFNYNKVLKCHESYSNNENKDFLEFLCKSSILYNKPIESSNRNEVLSNFSKTRSNFNSNLNLNFNLKRKYHKPLNKIKKRMEIELPDPFKKQKNDSLFEEDIYLLKKEEKAKEKNKDLKSLRNLNNKTFYKLNDGISKKPESRQLLIPKIYDFSNNNCYNIFD